MFLSYKKEFLKRIYLILVLILSMILLNFIIDPFQQYRIPRFYKIGNLREEERYLNAGLLRNTKYDSILIGSSITRNFDEEYFKKTMNWNVVKLTMSNAKPGEIKFVLDHVEFSKIKNIIIGVDLGAFKNIVNDGVKMPEYLYKNKLDFKDNYIYLSSIGVFKQSLKLIYYNLKYDKIEEKFKLGYQYNYSKKEFLKKEGMNNNFLNYELDLNNVPEEMVKNYNKTLKVILEKNKNINIILFFPPYSIIAYKNMIDEQKTIQDYLAFKNFLVNETSEYLNVKIYDFQDIKEITHNFDNYGDKLHYSPEISQKLIDYIAKDKYRINKKNVKERINNLKSQL